MFSNASVAHLGVAVNDRDRDHHGPPIPHITPLTGSANRTGAYCITASSLLIPVGGTLIGEGRDTRDAHCSAFRNS